MGGPCAPSPRMLPSSNSGVAFAGPIKALGSHNAYAHRSVTKAMGGLDDIRAVAPLLAALQDWRRDVRNAAGDYPVQLKYKDMSGTADVSLGGIARV